MSTPKNNNGKFTKKSENAPQTPPNPPADNAENNEENTQTPPIPPAPEPPKEQKSDEDPDVKGKIKSESAALKHFNKGYKLPEGDDLAYVTEDGQVFFKANDGSARAHARQNSLKLYTVKP